GDLALLHQPASLGDYNGDGVVNLADYTVWRNALGSTTDLAANGNDFGASMNRIDEADYLVWKANFGTMPGSALLAVPSHPVPEAASSWLALAFGTLLIAKRRRGRCGR